MGAFTHYVITQVGEGVSNCLHMIMGWPYDDICKNNFFSQNEIVLTQKTINN